MPSPNAARQLTPASIHSPRREGSRHSACSQVINIGSCSMASTIRSAMSRTAAMPSSTTSRSRRERIVRRDLPPRSRSFPARRAGRAGWRAAPRVGPDLRSSRSAGATAPLRPSDRMASRPSAAPCTSGARHLVHERARRSRSATAQAGRNEYRCSSRLPYEWKPKTRWAPWRSIQSTGSVRPTSSATRPTSRTVASLILSDLFSGVDLRIAGVSLR